MGRVAEFGSFGDKMKQMIETAQTPKARPAMLCLLTLAVFLLHIAAGFILYRGRVVSRWAVSQSDLVVLGVPILLAIAGYFYALRYVPWFKRHPVTRMTTAFAAAYLSFWGCLMLSLNKYGS